jgi:hypothetical protein
MTIVLTIAAITFGVLLGLSAVDTIRVARRNGGYPAAPLLYRAYGA